MSQLMQAFAAPPGQGTAVNTRGVGGGYARGGGVGSVNSVVAATNVMGRAVTRTVSSIDKALKSNLLANLNTNTQRKFASIIVSAMNAYSRA